MSKFKSVTNPSHAKIGIFGPQGSGKTWTAVEIALGLRKKFKIDAPLVMIDSEKGAKWRKDRVLKETGLELQVAEDGSFNGMLESAREAEAMGAVLVLDSISRFWKELNTSYLLNVQAAQKRAGYKRIKQRLDVGDIGKIKEIWDEWVRFFLNAKIHIVVCGREGIKWEWEYDEEKDKKEMVAAGAKMKTETEFGHEPDLLIQMRQEQDDTKKILHVAKVFKDRSERLMGKEITNPTFKSFLPFLEFLDPGSHTVAALDPSSKLDVTVYGDGREKQERAIVLEKIGNAMGKVFGAARTDEAKAQKIAALESHWGTGAWTEISERMPLVKLNDGLTSFYGEHPKAMPEPPKDAPPPSDDLPEWMKTDDEKEASADAR